jgi:hypothetical protein
VSVHNPLHTHAPCPASKLARHGVRVASRHVCVVPCPSCPLPLSFSPNPFPVQSTDPLPFNAGALAVQDALRGLKFASGTPTVFVSEANNANNGKDYTITFDAVGPTSGSPFTSISERVILSERAVGDLPLVGAVSSLTGTTPSLTVAPVTDGHSPFSPVIVTAAIDGPNCTTFADDLAFQQTNGLETGVFDRTTCVLCCAVLCFAVMCCAVLCGALRCFAVLCCVFRRWGCRLALRGYGAHAVQSRCLLALIRWYARACVPFLLPPPLPPPPLPPHSPAATSASRLGTASTTPSPRAPWRRCRS